jgi:hypothetical protein
MRGLAVSRVNSDTTGPNFWKLKVNVDTTNGWEGIKTAVRLFTLSFRNKPKSQSFSSGYKEIKCRIIEK